MPHMPAPNITLQPRRHGVRSTSTPAQGEVAPQCGCGSHMAARHTLQVSSHSSPSLFCGGLPGSRHSLGRAPAGLHQLCERHCSPADQAVLQAMHCELRLGLLRL